MFFQKKERKKGKYKRNFNNNLCARKNSHWKHADIRYAEEGGEGEGEISRTYKRIRNTHSHTHTHKMFVYAQVFWTKNNLRKIK
jgi:hypothetical protein